MVIISRTTYSGQRKPTLLHDRGSNDQLLSRLLRPALLTKTGTYFRKEAGPYL